MKTCTKCATEKPVTDFGRNKGTSDGLKKWCKPCHNAYQAEYRKKNPEQTAAAVADWHKKNPERVAHIKRHYYDKNTTEVKARAAGWKKRNPEKMRAFENNRRARLLSQGVMPADAYRRLANFFGEQCMYPGCEAVEKLHIDHVVPLSKDGSNTLDNAQLLCAHHNTSKGNRSSADYRGGRICN